MNVTFGGTLHQDIKGHFSAASIIRTTHSAKIYDIDLCGFERGSTELI
jgi:hypothetical protein